MKITTEEGEFELILDRKNSTTNSSVYNLKPVKKTEKKEEYYLVLNGMLAGENEYLVSIDLDLTSNQAQKLSEAISALVEYVIREGAEGSYPMADLEDSAVGAKNAYQGGYE